MRGKPRVATVTVILASAGCGEVSDRHRRTAPRVCAAAACVRPARAPRRRTLSGQVSWLTGQRNCPDLPRVAPSGTSWTAAHRLQLRGQRGVAPASLLVPRCEWRGEPRQAGEEHQSGAAIKGDIRTSLYRYIPWMRVSELRTPITGRPPHRTVRAEFPHTAPTLGV